MKKFLLFCFASVCLLACEKTKEEIPVSSVSINQPSAEMIEGETVQLKATVLPTDATDKTVEWSSSKQSVATISDKGLVTAIAEGTSTITASAGGKSASCVVTVSKRVIEVTSVTLNKESLELVEGEEETLVATVLPDNATDKTVTWSSSAPDIAKVDGGKVSAIKEGEATITAKAGTKSASCKVVVKKKFIAVESIELNKTNLELVEGDSDILVATVKPDDATDKTVTWKSSDDSIVTVDDEGGIKAIKEGKATIAAKAGEKTATCEVAVSKKVIAVESITLDKTSISMVEDESTVLTATVKPDNATDKTVTWSSSDTGIATVKDGRVTSIKEGKATITAKAGDKEATCEIIVSKRIIEVTSITLNYPDLSLVKGDEQVLVATVEPDNATDKTVTWSSSNAQVASVDKEGKVKALKSGTATITAKAGEKTANCEVTVTTPVESVALDRTSMTLEEGQSTTLIATISPNDADEKTVTWSSSDANIVTVDQSGKVTAVKEGAATITAKACGKSATCEVSVKKQVIQVTSITLNKTSLTLEKGKSETLTATVKPDNANDKTVNWSSSDSSIATVDSNGMVIAVKAGQAVITAKAGEKTATCAVMVTVPVSSITLSESSLTMSKGQSVTLTATVNPEDATDKTVTWVSSDKAVATVDQNGKVVAKAGGKTTIIAACGGQTAECQVTVDVPVTSIKLNKTSLSLKKGETVTLTATVKPDDATDKTVTWNTSDASVATVSNGVVTAKKIGTAAITAKAGDKEATCSVTVEATPVTSITLDKTSASLKVGETVTLTATVKPDDATDKTVTWSTSDASVATVSNGVVTAKKIGTATITAYGSSGVSAACMVTVTRNLSLPASVEAIDLGLPSGLKWANMNVGATKPEEYGEYFAWGETEPKTDYSWSTYKWCDGSENTLTKYNNNSSYGTVDNKTVLDLEDDAAHVHWGGSWRLPTHNETNELINNCIVEESYENGVKGWRFTSKKEGFTDKHIFIPAAGICWDSGLSFAGSGGRWWTSSLYSSSPNQSYFLFDATWSVYHEPRFHGYTVRPVTE